jgi:hypothetical protein
MTSDEKDTQPAPPADTNTAASSASPASSPMDEVTAQIQRTHEQVVAALTTGYADTEKAMRAAEEAVTIAVHGAAKAVDIAQQTTTKPAT